MAAADFRTPTVAAFLEELGSGNPTPGGGTGAAVAGAMGAALVRMLALVTAGKPKFAAAEDLMRAIAEEAGEAAAALMDLAAEDASAYDRVTDAYRRPRETEAEKASRTAAIQAAFRHATDVPLRVMERAAAVIGLAKNAIERGNPNAASDGAAGAELCRAAMKIAAYNVKVNLASLTDEAFRKEARTRMDEILYMGTSVANVIDSHVNDLWKA
jgi:formiminotetrahydrofolate cyclodeaminase